jgi:acyl-CoA synthetase (AMP-forming)/AMP-acid ligase II
MEEGSKAWSFDSASVNLVAMPLFHIAGSGWGVAGLCNGAANVLVREVNPAEILRLVAAHGVTNALFVPAVLQILLATPGVERTDFSTLRSIVYGASPISEEVLVRSMETFGCRFVQAYGLTETTGGVVALEERDHDPGGARAHLLRSAGRPWGDVELRIVDPASRRDLGEDEVGEIWVRSAQNMKGYWRNPEATAECYPEGRGADGRGWFRTGDAGYLRDGYLYIHDRVKDMIVSGGENIAGSEIERVLYEHESVVEAAVVGRPDDRWGEVPVAYVALRAAATTTPDELIEHCRGQLAKFKVPKDVVLVDALPRNPSGKVLKRELRQVGHEAR